MKVLVCGGREYDNWAELSYTLDRVLESYLLSGDMEKPLTIIQGGAKGADFLSRVWVKHTNLAYVTQEEYPANWNRYGKSAGPIRNKTMLDVGRPDFVIAFSGDRGTKDMISQAEQNGVPVTKI